MFPAFAALPGTAGAMGGLGGFGGPTSSGPATNSSVNVIGLGNGSESALNQILTFAAGGPPSNGGINMSGNVSQTQAYAPPNPSKANLWVPIAIGGIVLVALFFALKK